MGSEIVDRHSWFIVEAQWDLLFGLWFYIIGFQILNFAGGAQAAKEMTIMQ